MDFKLHKYKAEGEQLKYTLPMPGLIFETGNDSKVGFDNTPTSSDRFCLLVSRTIHSFTIPASPFRISRDVVLF